ncbi:MAG: ABC transporter ATP-binding protein, partial [Alphaproteobacteria bacterium]
MTEAAPRVPFDKTAAALTRRLLKDHVRPHLGRSAAALLCMALVAAATAALAKLMEPILDGVFVGHDRSLLAAVGVAVLVVFVVKGLATYGQAVLMNHVGFRIVADIQIAMFAHLMRADLAFFHDNHSGGLVSRFISDVQTLRKGVAECLTGLGKDLLTLLFLVALMFHQDWGLALIAFFAFPAAAVPIVKIGRRLRRVSAATQHVVGGLSTLLEEAFQGVRHVKAYGMESYEERRASVEINRLFRLYSKSVRARVLAHPIMEGLAGLAVFLVIAYGGYQVIEGARTPGAFFSFLTALFLAYEPMKRLAQLNATYQEALAAAERVFALLDTAPAIVDRPGACELQVRAGAVRFESVEFAYKPEVPALAGVSLSVPAGKTAALVGPSGAGKSTVLNLIPRFYDATRGRVTIDGVDVRDVTLASLRASIGLVSQEISLFDDTVRANIAYGRALASDDEIRRAARLAGADDFIAAMPEGYDTRIGELGVKLSGGQR